MRWSRPAFSRADSVQMLAGRIVLSSLAAFCCLVVLAGATNQVRVSPKNAPPGCSVQGRFVRTP